MATERLGLQSIRAIRRPQIGKRLLELFPVPYMDIIVDCPIRKLEERTLCFLANHRSVVHVANFESALVTRAETTNTLDASEPMKHEI